MNIGVNKKGFDMIKLVDILKETKGIDVNTQLSIQVPVMINLKGEPPYKLTLLSGERRIWKIEKTIDGRKVKYGYFRGENAPTIYDAIELQYL